MWSKILCVGCGGFLGATGRYLVSIAVARWLAPKQFPVATLTVNVLGCLVIGMLIAKRDWASQHTDLAAFVIIGVLGGLTTFSSFGSETFLLVRSESIGLAVANVMLNTVLGLGAVWLGFALIKPA